MTSSESEEQSKSKKRPRTSANSDEAGDKKARGRPRVDTQDATAADRRRTQIRLAQRAYRQRKETTISSLKQKNAQLQSVIEQMNIEFLRFNESAQTVGLLSLSPTLGRELEQTTETLVGLVKSANDQRPDEGEEVDELILHPAAESQGAARSESALREYHEPLPLPVSQHTTSNIVPFGWGYAATLKELHPPRSPTWSQKQILQHSNFFQEPFKSANQLSTVELMPSVSQKNDQSRLPKDKSYQQSLPFGVVDFRLGDLRRYSSPHGDIPQTFPVNISPPLSTPQITNLPPPPDLPNCPESLSIRTLPPSWTYSHDETTFARRMTRCALEKAFYLLSNAQQQPMALNRIFKLSLSYQTLGELREKFKMLLSRSTEEELDFWDTPFIHLGGAGTHYPRKDAQGNLVDVPNSWTVRRIGPPYAKRLRAENSTDPSQNHDISIDFTGLEGEWFDAHDVQGYLEERKGCFIDPKSSFAEVLIEVDDETNTKEPGSLFNKNMHTEYSDVSTASPGRSSGSSSEPSISSKSTSGHSVGGMNAVLGLTGASFGVHNSMNAGGFEFGKGNNNDHSSMYDQPLGLDLAPSVNTNFGSTMAGFSATAFGNMSSLGSDLIEGGVEYMPPVKPRVKKPALLDVSKFLDEAMGKGVCLGRGPGFRRADIDRAFYASLIEPF